MKSHPFTLYFDEIYSSGLDRTARFPVDRYSMVAEKLIDLDKDQRINWAKPRLATKEEILEVIQLTSIMGIHSMSMGVPILMEEIERFERNA